MTYPFGINEIYNGIRCRHCTLSEMAGIIPTETKGLRFHTKPSYAGRSAEPRKAKNTRAEDSPVCYGLSAMA